MGFKEQAKCEKIARTGRVESWLEDPEGRLAVSCTTFAVKDSMEGRDGIEASWRFTSHGLRNGAGVAIHLSDLREKGEENGKGLVASGPVSFGKIYSTLNEILRRGGKYKNGAVVLHLDYTHPDVLGKVVDWRYEPGFIDTPRAELPWAKRCLNVDDNFLDTSSPELINALLKGISSGDIWLNKIRYDEKGNRLRGNVCLEVYLPHRGTCLLQHVNLGACKVEDLRNAFKQGMTELCELHARTGVGDTGEYLPPEEDRQVGLGMLGLANFLSIHSISYKDFGDALEALTMDDPQPWCHHWRDQPAGQAAMALRDGIDAAAAIARKHGMERAFAIAPTATCSYRYLDARGFTTAPEIAPPIARLVDRDSETMGVERFDYGPVETAEEVGWEEFRIVADGIMRLLDDTGLLHGYSMNWWSDLVACDEDFLREWLESPQTSLYYALQVQSGTQAKDDVGVELGESLTSFFGLEDTDEVESCSVDAGFCAACAE
jgi:hypothetical protein